MHFLSSRGLKIWVGIALLKKKEMYFLEKADVSPKSVDTSAFCCVYGVFIPPSPFLPSIGAKCALLLSLV